jgi:hypothetical protein
LEFLSRLDQVELPLYELRRPGISYFVLYILFLRAEAKKEQEVYSKET